MSIRRFAVVTKTSIVRLLFVVILIAASGLLLPEVCYAYDPCAVSERYDQAKQALTRIGYELKLKGLPPKEDWNLSVALKVIRYAKQLPRAPGQNRPAASLAEVERNIREAATHLQEKEEEIKRKEDAYRIKHGRLPKDQLKEFWAKHGIGSWDTKKSPEDVQESIAKLEEEFAKLEKQLEETGNEAPSDPVSADSRARLAKLLPGVDLAQIDLTDFDQLDKLRLAREKTYQINVPDTYGDDWGPFVQRDVQTLLSFRYFDDPAMQQKRDRLERNIRIVRDESWQLDTYKDEMAKDAKKLISMIEQKQQSRTAGIKQAIDDIEKQVRTPAPAQQGQADSAKLEEKVEAVRTKLVARREWKSLLLADRKMRDVGNQKRRLGRIKENWDRYKVRFQKWDKADQAVKEWNRARDAWVAAREKNDDLLVKARMQITSVDESLRTEEKKIKEEIYKREKSKGDALHKRLKQAVANYKRSRPRNPNTRKQLNEKIQRYELLYELDGWKEKVKPEVRQKVRRLREGKARELLNLARRADRYNCFEDMRALAGRLRSKAKEIAPWMPIDDNAPLNPDGPAGDMVALPALKLPDLARLKLETYRMRLKSVKLKVMSGLKVLEEKDLGPASGSIPVGYEHKWVNRNNKKRGHMKASGTFSYTLPAELPLQLNEVTGRWQGETEVSATAQATFENKNHAFGKKYQIELGKLKSEKKWVGNESWTPETLRWKKKIEFFGPSGRTVNISMRLDSSGRGLNIWRSYFITARYEPQLSEGR